MSQALMSPQQSVLQSHAHAHAHVQMTRMQVLDKLGLQLPLNELGLPKYLYRADLIPSDFFSLPSNEQNQILNAATLGITYREGYPTFFDALPIWDQMDQEEAGDFGLFQIYLDLGEKLGYRQLSLMPDEIASRFPSLKPANDDETRKLLRRVQELSTLNFWLLRSKAYDLFKVAMARKVREKRLMSIEDVHFLEADNILNKLKENFLKVFTSEAIETMTPLEFVKAMKLVTEVQRTALGLSATGSTGSGKKDEGAPPAHASIEVIARSVAKTSGAVDSGRGADGSNARVLEMLQQPDVAEAAQEFIIKVAMGDKPKELTNASTNALAVERANASDERADLAMIHGDSD